MQSMQFWQDFAWSSPIDDILKSENFKLEDLLDEDDVIQEMRNHKQELIDFLAKPAQLQKLLDYLTVEPPEDANEKLRLRYPAIACELLCSEIDEMDSLVVSSNEYLDRLFGFFDKDSPNPFLTSFVCRVISCLLLVKMKEMLAYMKSQPNFLAKLLKHLNVPAVTDFITKLINLETQPEAQGTLQWLCEQKLILQIIQKFEPSNAENHSDVAQALLDIINASKPDSPLLMQLADEKTVQLLLDYMLSKTKGSSSALQHGLTVVIGMLSILGTLIQSDDEGEDDTMRSNANNTQGANTSTMSSSGDGDGSGNNNAKNESSKGKGSEVPPWIRLLLKHLPQFKDILINPPEPKKMHLPFGTIEKAFGFERLKILDFIEVLLVLQSKSVDEALLEQDIFTVIFDLFFEYDWNNFLHHSVKSIVDRIFDDDHDEIKSSLFTRTKIIPRLLQAVQLNQEQEAKGGRRKSNMAHLLAICSKIKEHSEHDEIVKAHTRDNEEWKKFAETILKEKEDLEKEPLGGVKPQRPEGFVGGELGNLSRPLGGAIGGLSDFLSQVSRGPRFMPPMQSTATEAENPEESPEENPETNLDYNPEGDGIDEQEQQPLPTEDDNADRQEEEVLEFDDDIDFDSENDADDYDTEQAEVLLTKQEIEAIEV
jgi:serine/threonine-protein phosphatase 6 regulatory subunit 1